MSVEIIYNFEAVQGRADALLVLLQKVRDLGITVAGCEAYDVYQGKDNPHKLVMIERWTSEETHKAFFEKSVKSSGVLDSVVKLMVEPPQGAYYLHRTPNHLAKPNPLAGKTTEDLLTEKVGQLQSIMDQVGAYIFTKDMQGRYTFANKMVCDLFGYPLEEVVGFTDEKFFDLSICNQLRINDRRVLEQGKRIESEETNVVAETGETRIYWTVKIPWKAADGTITGMCGISTDITERRSLEVQVQEQKLLLESILNNIDSYVYMKDRDRRYLYANANTATLYGLPQEEIIGKLDADMMTREIADQFGIVDRQVLDTGNKVCAEESFHDKSGATRHYWSIKVPLVKEGEVNSFVGISTDITEIIQLKESFKLLANTDVMTGISSRRHLMENAELELKRMRRRGETMAVIMFDIDKFKSVNDGYGHATGDRAIVAVADACKKALREIDLFGRQGGDEFLVVAPEIDLPSALVVAERLREAISSTSVMCDDGTAITITSSFGLTISDSKSSLDELLSQADAALYEAKGHGRNCVWHDKKTLGKV